MDHAELERFFRVERRQDARQPLSQHRLAGARRADHQQVVAAGRGHFERALGGFLALDIGQIGIASRLLGDAGLRWRQDLGALEVIDECDQVGRRQNFALTGLRRLAAIRFRADDAALPRVGVDRGRQHARDRAQRSVEGQFTKRDIRFHVFRAEHIHDSQQAKLRWADRNGCLPSVGRPGTG